MKSIEVRYSADLRFPEICACCQKPCKASDFMQVGLTLPSNTFGKEKTYNIPTCAFCQQHWQATNRHNRITMFVFGAAALAAFGFYNANEDKSFWLTVGVGVAFIVIAKLLLMAISPSKIKEPGHVEPGEGGDLQTEPATARYEVKGELETVLLSFVHASYADRVAEMNVSAKAAVSS